MPRPNTSRPLASPEPGRPPVVGITFGVAFARRLVGNKQWQVGRALDRLAVVLEDDVAHLDAALGCGARLVHGGDERAARTVEAERGGQGRVHFLHHDAEVAARCRAFDTICSATQERQDAVVELLRFPLDGMVVIGGFNSSNTLSLAALCSESVRTYHVEDAAATSQRCRVWSTRPRMPPPW